MTYLEIVLRQVALLADRKFNTNSNTEERIRIDKVIGDLMDDAYNYDRTIMNVGKGI